MTSKGHRPILAEFKEGSEKAVNNSYVIYLDFLKYGCLHTAAIILFNSFPIQGILSTAAISLACRSRVQGDRWTTKLQPKNHKCSVNPAKETKVSQ